MGTGYIENYNVCAYRIDGMRRSDISVCTERKIMHTYAVQTLISLTGKFWNSQEVTEVLATGRKSEEVIDD